MIAIVVALAAAAGFGWLRPRWSSLAVAAAFALASTVGIVTRRYGRTA